MLENKIKKLYKGKVLKVEKVSESSYFMEFEAGDLSAKPGQFISIYCEGLTLRRPFSVYSFNNGKIGILFKERGEGTKYLSSLKEGESVDIAGSFGNGFNIENKKSLLVGAGIGVAPMVFLQSELKKQGIENLFISGFLNKNEVINTINIDKIYTDDGSMGQKGSILEYLEDVIKEYKPEIIYSCAPYVVLKQAAKIGEKYGIKTQVAMEKVMACGIGVCRGCVIEVVKEGKIQNASVCKEGPVFYGNEVVWQ